MTEPAGAAALEGLNEAQRQAVSAPAGPTLVFAGAGSGKTRVLTRRIAWRVLADGAAPGGTLAVTFTNKAAREMTDRVRQFGNEELSRVWTSTFHALGLRLLRMFGEDAGLESGFAVLGADETKTLLMKIAPDLHFDLENDWKPAALPRLVSRARAAEALGEPLSVAGDSPRFRERMRLIRELADRYAEEVRRQNAVDFDDLILLPGRLLAKDGPAREFVGRRVRHLLVDEYQDTSPLQHRLIGRLAPHGDVFVVGDDDQAIYSFRGADHRNIQAFRRDFPDARVFRLEDNYRSTGAILDAANALIRRNAGREGKTLRAVGEAGAPVTLKVEPTQAREAAAVARAISERGDARGSCAVLYRTRAQSRAFEEAFANRRLPHLLVGGLRFYERKEVQDAVAGVRLAVRPNDDAAFRRALGAIPRGVGKATLDQIEAAAVERGVSLREAAGALLEEGRVSGRIGEGLAGFLAGLEAVRQAAGNGPVAVVEAALEETGLAEHHRERDEGERWEHLVSLRESAREFEQQNPEGGVTDFLDRVSLLSAEDFLPDSGGNAAAAPVVLMTVHAAKGLEFDTVFLCGLWEGLLPHQFSLKRRESLEEERRLFYVGMTRARKSLTLTAAPPGFGARGGISRFVGEIPKEMLRGGERALATARPALSAGYRRGDTVRHPRFGVGRVESVDPDGKKVSVLFRTAGRKRLVLEFAGLRPA